MPIFQTKLTHARLTLSPFSSEEMAQLGQFMIDTKTARIRRAVDSTDAPAKELAPSYASRKQRYNRAPIRDWTWSGQMLGSWKVKRADENRVTIGFANERADQKATIQRRKCEMLVDSPSDSIARYEYVRAMLRRIRVQVFRAAA